MTLFVFAFYRQGLDAVGPGLLEDRSVTAIGDHDRQLRRKVVLGKRGGLELSDNRLGRPLGEELLEPTRLYVSTVLDLMGVAEVKAAAHVTGGGLIGRGTKLVPQGCRLVLDPDSYAVPPIFDLIGEAGNVTKDELARTFNMGLGFMVVLSPHEYASKRSDLASGWLEVGKVIQGPSGVELGYARS
ncbi:MAG: AIR synthase-related protein [Myxococcota bacterium]